MLTARAIAIGAVGAVGAVAAACAPGDDVEANRDPTRWTAPSKPARIVGPIHFVGTRELGVYLITTPDGHVLLNGGPAETEELIRASIAELGFRVEDIKWLISNHAHFDHVGTHAGIQRASRAKVAASAADAELLGNGGRTDFKYGKLSAFRFDSVHVDRILRDNDTLRLGNVELVALRTPGHTKGGTTWVTTVRENDSSYTVVFPEGFGINPGYRLKHRRSYDSIAVHYQRSFHVLDSLSPAIWLGSHTSFFDFHSKRALAATAGAAAWVDTAGYRALVREARRKFEATVAAERLTRR